MNIQSYDMNLSQEENRRIKLQVAMVGVIMADLPHPAF
jgi:hypothetical protein